MHKSTSCYRSFWSSMYLWTTDRDTAPTEEMDALLVQSVGNLVYRSGYLPRIFHALMPFSRWTQRMMPKRGLQSMSRPTWSGITSISRIWKWYYPATSRKISFRSWSLGGGSTFRLYFGQKMTWYWQLNTRCSEEWYCFSGL